MLKKKKSKVEIQHGLWKIWGFTINLNSVLTTIFGSVGCTLVAACLYYIHAGYTDFVTMERDVPKLEQTLHRLETEYPPLPKANFSASLKTAAAPSPTP